MMAEDWKLVRDLPPARSFENGTWILLTSTWNEYMRVAVYASHGAWLDIMEHDHTDEVDPNKGSATHYMLWPTDPPAKQEDK